MLINAYNNQQVRRPAIYQLMGLRRSQTKLKYTSSNNAQRKLEVLCAMSKNVE